jgi:hypothetical protein
MKEKAGSGNKIPANNVTPPAITNKAAVETEKQKDKH